MTSLSTHVLDTMHGRPAAGLKVALSGPDGEIARSTTNPDGRCPDLAQGGLAPGRYALRFSVAEYFRGLGVTLPDPPFLDEVGVEFGVAENGGHYHVPLLVSPFAYSTYRGS
jgi:5-hydroxyisourate hydrolase